MAVQSLGYLWYEVGVGQEDVPEMDCDCSIALLPVPAWRVWVLRALSSPSSYTQMVKVPPSLTEKSLASCGQEPPQLPFWSGSHYAWILECVSFQMLLWAHSLKALNNTLIYMVRCTILALQSYVHKLCPSVLQSCVNLSSLHSRMFS